MGLSYWQGTLEASCTLLFTLGTAQNSDCWVCGRKVRSCVCYKSRCTLIYVSWNSFPWVIGLAEAAVQEADATILFPPLFETANSGTSGLVTQIASIAISSKGKKSSANALAILSRIAQDPAFKPSVIGIPTPRDGDETTIDRVARVCNDALLKFLGEWSVEPEHDDMVSKLEEVIWMNVLVYAVGGWGGREQGQDEHKQFNGDFFLWALPREFVSV